jgi:GDPmannose 4,6-dehydratase
LITGVSGQDGQLLARQLSGRGSEIVGILPPGTPAAQTEWVDEVPGLTLLPADLSDPATCREIIAEVRPDVVFHLAGRGRSPFRLRN